MPPERRPFTTSDGFKNFFQSCVPRGSQPRTYSAPAMASAQALAVRLSVDRNNRPPGFTMRPHDLRKRSTSATCSTISSASTMSNCAPDFGQRLGRALAIVDRQRLSLGVQGGDIDVLRGRVDAGHSRPQAGHRLAQKPAAAADVEQRQVLERRARQRIALPMGRGAVADVADAHWIQPVQRARTCRPGPTIPRRCARSARSRPDRRWSAQERL